MATAAAATPGPGRVVRRLFDRSRRLLFGRAVTSVALLCAVTFAALLLLVVWLFVVDHDGLKWWKLSARTEMDDDDDTLALSTYATKLVINVNPLESNANFGARLNDLLSTVSVACSRLLSVPTVLQPKRISTGRSLNFPSPEAPRWPICLEHLKSGACIVYSAKIGGSNEFEETVANLGCQVFLFDPSLDEEDVRRIELTGIRAFSWGLGSVNATIVTGVKKSKSNQDAMDGESEGGVWRYVKASEIIRELGHLAQTLDVLRLDLHGGEWDALQNLATTGTLSNIRQIVATTHVWRGEAVFNLIDRLMRTKKLIHSGFGIFHTEPMIDGDGSEQKCCRVVGWLRTNYPVASS